MKGNDYRKIWLKGNETNVKNSPYRFETELTGVDFATLPEGHPDPSDPTKWKGGTNGGHRVFVANKDKSGYYDKSGNQSLVPIDLRPGDAVRCMTILVNKLTAPESTENKSTENKSTENKSTESTAKSTENKSTAKSTSKSTAKSTSKKGQRKINISK